MDVAVFLIILIVLVLMAFAIVTSHAIFMEIVVMTSKTLVAMPVSDLINTTCPTMPCYLLWGYNYEV